MYIIKEASDSVGECQICGATQKLPKGRLANHGYTTKWGFFSGTCQGSHNLPYEESCDLCKEIIKLEYETIETNKKKIKDIVKNKENSFYIALRVYGESKTYKATAIEVNGEIFASYEEHRGAVKNIPLIKLKVYTTTIEDTIKYFREKEVKQLEQLNQQILTHIKWLEVRVVNWKPAQVMKVDIIQKKKSDDSLAKKVARDNMFYTYTTPAGIIEKRKRVQGKEVNFVVLAVLTQNHTDYRRNKGFSFYRGVEDLVTAEKLKVKLEKKAKEEFETEWVKDDLVKRGHTMQSITDAFTHFGVFNYTIVEVNN